jgi:pyruvate formate lyase activating enzyme
MVLRIERASIHDGPGIRTVVFLKGCPLACQWCSTPESQSPLPQTGLDQQVYGRVMTAHEVVDEVLKDEVFYFHSGGGVTVSGGEPLAQSAFTAAVLRGTKEHGIHTAIETTLFGSRPNVARVLAWTDHLLVDIKHVEDAEHRRWTGVANSAILENLRAVAASDFAGTITARVPLLPGVNDDDLNLFRTALICKEIPQLDQLELLPYHRLGRAAYRNLGLDYALDALEPPSAAHLADRLEYLNNAVPEVKTVLAR